MTPRVVENCTLGRMVVVGMLLSALAFALTGCAHSQRVNAKGAASDVLAGSYRAWRAFDAKHQHDIVDTSKTAADDLAKWRQTQFGVDAAFADARDAIATYSDAVTVGENPAIASAAAALIATMTRLSADLAQYGINLKIGDLLGVVAAKK